MHCVVGRRPNIVGRPMALELLDWGLHHNGGAFASPRIWPGHVGRADLLQWFGGQAGIVRGEGWLNLCAIVVI